MAVSLEAGEGFEDKGKVNHLTVKMLQKRTQSSAHVISACRQPVRRKKFGKELIFLSLRMRNFCKHVGTSSHPDFIIQLFL